MIIDDITANFTLNVRSAPTDPLVSPTKYRIGVAGQTITIPADANMISARDVAVPASGSISLFLNDFHIAPESVAFLNADCTDTDFLTMYAVVMTLLSEAITPSSGDTIKIVLTALDWTQTITAVENKAGAFAFISDPVGFTIGTLDTMTIIESDGLASSVVQVLVIGKDS